MNKLSELEILLKDVYEIYQKVCKDWEYRYKIYNQSKYTVKDMLNDIKKLLDVFTYRDFLNNDEMLKIIQVSNLNNVAHSRVKQYNSIIYKVANYYTKKIKGEFGTMSINKCLNDVFGLRVITEVDFNFQDVKDLIQKKFPKFKCINSSKGDYRAIHIYVKQDNFHYFWEVQLWYKGDEKKNHESHKKHKQEYTKWEKLFVEKKGGLK